MKTLLLSRASIGQGNLILVNARCPLDPEKPVPWLTALGRSNQLLEVKAASLLENCFADLDVRGRILPVSGWRSHAEQEELYAESVRENGPAFTAQYVALPGCSEHETGLAIDLALAGPDVDFIRPDFPDTGICRRFRERSPDYGFILRYPAGQEHVTGIAYEPWHFRYVGFPHSAIITAEGLTLEAYIQALRDYPYGGRALRFPHGGWVMEVGFLPVEEETAAAVPDTGPVQVSGNNVDGVILTTWRAA